MKFAVHMRLLPRFQVCHSARGNSSDTVTTSTTPPVVLDLRWTASFGHSDYTVNEGLGVGCLLVPSLQAAPTLTSAVFGH